MPIEIRSRIPTAPARAAQDQTLHNHLDFYLNRRTGFEPEVIVRAARDQEELGFDSSLFPQFSTRPAVWPVVGWALSATTRLRLVAAHRIGPQLPAIAARTLAALDRLSSGRIAVHVLQGREEADLQREGIFISKDEGYRRSHEYLDIFLQTLTATEPFSYEGEHYRIENALSDVRPVQWPRPVVSIPGTSDAGIALAVKYADVHTVPIPTLETAQAAIAKVRGVASAQGRTRPLGFWGDSNVILGETDDAAWDQAHAVGAAVAEVKGEGATPTYAHGDARPGVHAHEGPVWYPRLNQLTGHGYTLVGSPATLADYYLGLYRAGVTVVTLGGIGNHVGEDGATLDGPGQRALLRELIDRLHAGALDIDRAADRAAA